jgi:hypothetical protein
VGETNHEANPVSAHFNFLGALTFRHCTLHYCTYLDRYFPKCHSGWHTFHKLHTDHELHLVVLHSPLWTPRRAPFPGETKKKYAIFELTSQTVYQLRVGCHPLALARALWVRHPCAD